MPAAPEGRPGDVRSWLRSMCLRLYDEKGSFSLHGDPRSQEFLDLAFWVFQRSLPSGQVTTLAEFRDRVVGRMWFSDRPGGLGLGGFAPDFVDDWWKDRHEAGTLARSGRSSRMTDAAARAILAAWQKSGQTFTGVGLDREPQDLTTRIEAEDEDRTRGYDRD